MAWCRRPAARTRIATAARAQQEACERGLLLLTCGPHANVVRMIPALVVTAEQVDQAVALWADAVAAARSS